MKKFYILACIVISLFTFYFTYNCIEAYHLKTEISEFFTKTYTNDSFEFSDVKTNRKFEIPNIYGNDSRIYKQIYEINIYSKTLDSTFTYTSKSVKETAQYFKFYNGIRPSDNKHPRKDFLLKYEDAYIAHIDKKIADCFQNAFSLSENQFYISRTLPLIKKDDELYFHTDNQLKNDTNNYDFYRCISEQNILNGYIFTNDLKDVNSYTRQISDFISKLTSDFNINGKFILHFIDRNSFINDFYIQNDLMDYHDQAMCKWWGHDRMKNEFDSIPFALKNNIPLSERQSDTLFQFFKPRYANLDQMINHKLGIIKYKFSQDSITFENIYIKNTKDENEKTRILKSLTKKYWGSNAYAQYIHFQSTQPVLRVCIYVMEQEHSKYNTKKLFNSFCSELSNAIGNNIIADIYHLNEDHLLFSKYLKSALFKERIDELYTTEYPGSEIEPLGYKSDLISFINTTSLFDYQYICDYNIRRFYSKMRLRPDLEMIAYHYGEPDDIIYSHYLYENNNIRAISVNDYPLSLISDRYVSHTNDKSILLQEGSSVKIPKNYIDTIEKEIDSWGDYFLLDNLCNYYAAISIFPDFIIRREIYFQESGLISKIYTYCYTPQNGWNESNSFSYGYKNCNTDSPDLVNII